MVTIKKLDLKNELRPLYSAKPGKPAFIEIPNLKFLMIEGTGDPNGSKEFEQAVQILYSIAYTLKFSIKNGPLGVEYPVMALEGLWRMKDGRPFEQEAKQDWAWTLMICQPELITSKLFADARRLVVEKKGLPAAERTRLEHLSEGMCAQVMHVGRYSEEAPTIKMLHDFVAAEGCSLRGDHHEIYVGDPRRSAPEKLKTIIRHPVKKPDQLAS